MFEIIFGAILRENARGLIFVSASKTLFKHAT
jgi:hypothetical protein